MDPVTLIDPALDAVTVSVSDCPEEMVLELAVIETVGAPVPDPPPEPELTVIVVWELALPLEFVAVAV